MDHIISFNLISLEILKRIENDHKDIKLKCKNVKKNLIKYNKLNLLDYLIKHYNINLNHLNGYSLLKSVELKNYDMIHLLLDYDVDYSINDYQPVKLLIKYNELDILQRLDLPNHLTNLLFIAVKYKNYDIIKFLMEQKGFRPNIKIINLINEIGI